MRYLPTSRQSFAVTSTSNFFHLDLEFLRGRENALPRRVAIGIADILDPIEPRYRAADMLSIFQRLLAPIGKSEAALGQRVTIGGIELSHGSMPEAGTIAYAIDRRGQFDQSAIDRRRRIGAIQLREQRGELAAVLSPGLFVPLRFHVFFHRSFLIGQLRSVRSRLSTCRINRSLCH